MDPNELVAGVFDVIDTEEHVAPQPKAPAEKPAQPKTETPAPAKTADKPKEDDGPDDEIGDDEQDFSRNPVPKSNDDTDSDEHLQTEKPTDTEPVDWKATLPPAPAPFTLQAPQPDEYGQIDPLEYTTYVTEKAKAEMRAEAYAEMVQNRALDEAERILPELKTNPVLQKLVRDSYLAQTYSGQQGDVVEIAKGLKEAFGEKVAEGAKNAKTSIEIQKNSAIETSSTKKKSAPSKLDKLDKRLQAGDTSAFEELMETWIDDGKV